MTELAEPTRIETEYVIQWYRPALGDFIQWGASHQELEPAQRTLAHLRGQYPDDGFRIVKHSVIHRREYLDD